MVLEAAEALLTKDNNQLTREDILRQIPQYLVKPILRRHKIKREVKIGLVGLPGDGKSASGALITMVDFMLEGVPCWSNMQIGIDIVIDDATARIFTGGALKTGGTVTFKTEPFDKKAFVKFDPKYKHGIFFIDEVNMELFESRRSMSNVNLYADRAVQQLRKYESSLIYTVIDEMWIDPRLRDNTDIFIKCEETGLSVEGLAAGKPLGQDFKLTIFDVTGRLRGRELSYHNTKKPLPPVYLNFKNWQGIYDDKQLQAAGGKKYSFDFLNDEGEEEAGAGRGMSFVPSGKVRGLNELYGEYMAKLPQLVDSWREQGLKWVEREEVYDLLGLDAGNSAAKDFIGKQLGRAGFRLERHKIYLPIYDGDMVAAALEQS